MIRNKLIQTAELDAKRGVHMYIVTSRATTLYYMTCQ